jgi:toxin-antitoxin system PIN domain toxin
VLVDANLLVYALNEEAPEHEPARQWLEGALNGDRRVGLPWESLTSVVRLLTNPRIVASPQRPDLVWSIVRSWLDVPVVWIPGPTERHADVFGALLANYRPTGKLVPDAHLAAIAVQHGLDVYSADTDFARFREIRWINPLGG